MKSALKKSPPERTEFVTFGYPNVSDRFRPGPHVWNGEVHIRRYRVVVELMDEPDEIIRQRIIDLWAGSTNGHDRAPLHDMAAKYGLDLHTCGVEYGSRWPSKPRR